MSFANPAALWALLGIPCVLLIHLLQRRSRRQVVSTLFLLGEAPPRSRSGTAIDRLRSSASLWLQLLSVLVLTWMLAEPRFLRADSSQRVVVLLDGSASMSAFLPRLPAAVERRAAALSTAAAHTEWTALDSALTERTLYAGGDVSALVRAIASWRPAHGTHDIRPSVRQARALAGAGGRVVFVGDHEDKPEGVDELLAVGSPETNVGFAGVTVEEDGWRALIRNHGRDMAERQWWSESGAARSPMQKLRLAPGETRTVSGRFSGAATEVELRLTPDAFALDDRLPLVNPRRKPLTISVAAAGRPALEHLVSRLLESWGDVTRAAAHEPADLRVVSDGRDAAGAAIVTPLPAASTVLSRQGLVIVARDPLTEGLAWQGLLIARLSSMAPAATDRVLVWHAGRGLVWLRGERTLVFGFPLESSNADRLPAFVLLVRRFVEMQRQAKPAYELANLETGQALSVASLPGAGLELLSEEGRSPAPRLLHAPLRPGFFEVRSFGTALLRAAAHFADVREADLSGCSSAEEETAALRGERLARSREDPLAPVWPLVLALLLLSDWWLAARRSAVGDEGAPATPQSPAAGAGTNTMAQRSKSALLAVSDGGERPA